MLMTLSKYEQQLKKDPATSFWLRDQLKATEKRDPIDALNDAELLVSSLKARLETLHRHQNKDKDKDMIEGSIQPMDGQPLNPAKNITFSKRPIIENDK